MTVYNNQNIPFIAGDTTWDNWNGNMLHYFGQEPLPLLPEEQWRDFGKSMISLVTFSAYGIPDPDGFQTWQDWVYATIGAVNGPNQ